MPRPEPAGAAAAVAAAFSRSRGRSRPGVLVVAFLVAAALLVEAPVAATRGPAGPDATDWSARRIGRLGVASLAGIDRAALSGLPSTARVGIHPGTGEVRFVGGSPRHPLAAPPGAADHGLAASDGRPSARSGQRLTRDAARRAATAFMREHGRLFGLSRPGVELRATEVDGAAVADAGDRVRRRLGPVVRLRQVREGIPVLGGEAVVALGARGEVLSVAGEFLPSRWEVSTRPALDARAARSIAAAWLAREAGRRPGPVTTRSEGLAIHDTRIMGGEDGLRPGPRLVWQVDARVDGGPDPIDRLVLVDAHGGQVVTSIDRIAHLDRRVCDLRDVPRRDESCESVTRGEGQGATGIADVDAAYRLMGVVDAWFRTVLGRDGADGEGAPMVASVRYCSLASCPLHNAYWRWHLQQATFGRGWASDDIVGHEYTHGVIDHTARLFYHDQSGAINESFADVFGELIDLREPSGRDTAWTRWKIGEDSSLGVLRDMRDPPAYGDADRVRSPRWRTGDDDDGGVHGNSGVGNKAAWLVAAGGSFNGERVAGIGMERTARIWYRALVAHLVPAADYIDLGDALLAACVELAGRDGITLEHCGSVRAATRATEMHLRPLAATPAIAPICAAGRFPVDAFVDDLEDPGAGRWRPTRLAGDVRTWYYPPNPNHDPTWDATWSSSGRLNLYGADRGRRTDAVMTLVDPVTLPERAYLRFEHGFDFDAGRRAWDGGVVEVSLDGGPWRDLGSRATHGGYTGRLARSNGNPLGGRRAYTRGSHGYGSSRFDLSDFAGRQARIRFRVATDRDTGAHGWYIDDIRVYRCVRDAERPVARVEIDEGAPSTATADVSLRIEASDDASGVTRLLVSNSGDLVDGRLADGLAMEPREALDWSLTARSWGGTATLGTKRVYVQVRDGAGRWSEVARDRIELVASD